MQAPATHALLQKVDRMLAALMTQENTDGVFEIEMGTTYFDRSTKTFPESYPDEWRKVNVTFKGSTVEAALEPGTLFGHFMYAGDIQATAQKHDGTGWKQSGDIITADKIREIQTTKWGLADVQYYGSNNTKCVTFKCNDLRFTLSRQS